MMLNEIIDDMYLNDRNYWDYYEGITVNSIRNPDRANDFIFEFFDLGSKGNIFQNEFDKNRSGDIVFRHDVHTIKVFFIGIFLQKQLDRGLSIKSDTFSNYPFSYIWYLSCLFHDYGYRFEHKTLTEMDYCRMRKLGERNVRKYRNSRLDYYRILRTGIKFVSPNIPFKNRCYLSNGFSIAGNRKVKQSERIFDTCNKQCNGFITFSNGTIITENHYCNRIKNNYFKYIVFEHNHIDHGIAGADYLYYKLTENFRCKSKYLSNMVEWTDFTDESGRSFNCEQFKIFAYISDCIACHNIWKADEKSQKKYIEYQLESLLNENFKVISYKDNPLLFVLCLADSIEPTKKINNIDAEEVLESIEFDYCADSKKLKVLIAKELSANFKCKEYIKNLESLEIWIDIKVEVILV